MIIANHSCDLPGTLLVLPEVNKLCLTRRLCVLPPWMVKAVNTHLNRAITIHGIHLERSWNELSAHLAADVVLDARDQALP